MQRHRQSELHTHPQHVPHGAVPPPAERSPAGGRSPGRPPGRRRRRLRNLRHVPVLPSLITLGNIFFGYLAIAKMADAARIYGGDPAKLAEAMPLVEMAALLVFVAMVFDAIDGAVARLTNQATPFGAQLDSLADVVTFGVASAFIAKVVVDFHALPGGLLPPHPKLYYAAAAIFVLCAAMRLARFNVESSSPDEDDHKEFAGLPTPGAAAVICSLVAFLAVPMDSKNTLVRRLLPDGINDWIVMSLPLALVMLGLLMVSRIPFPHFVSTVVRGRHSFPFLATLVILVGIAAVEWQLALACCTLAYVAAGLVIGTYRFLTTGRLDRPAIEGAGDGPDDGPDDNGYTEGDEV